jgi:hypothetical protein
MDKLGSRDGARAILYFLFYFLRRRWLLLGAFIFYVSLLAQRNLDSNTRHHRVDGVVVQNCD